MTEIRGDTKLPVFKDLWAAHKRRELHPWEAWEYYFNAVGSPPPASESGPNARIYWEMYGGLPIRNMQDDAHVIGADLTMKIGGHRAKAGYLYYQVSVYARPFLDSTDQKTLYTRIIDTEPGELWRTVRINIKEADIPISTRCLVVKIESTAPTHATLPADTTEKTYADQTSTADPPPWGFKLLKSKVWGCEYIGRNTRPMKILEDITRLANYTVSGPPDTFVVNQMTFTEIPHDRWESLDAVNALLGYDYACWDGHEIEFTEPGSGTVRLLDVADPATVWSYEQNIDETFNSVRVTYNDVKGRPREEVTELDSAVLGDVHRADVVAAPDSMKSAQAARKIGTRYLRDHNTAQTDGSVTVIGNVGHDDALLFRPGDMIQMTGPKTIGDGKPQKATRVTLHLTEWSADVQFGVNSKRFDQWLARLAAGAKTIKRR